MENKYVGYLLIGISIIFIGIIIIFNTSLKEIVSASCTIAHGTGICPMYDTIDKQTYLALSITSIIIFVGLILILTKPKEKLIIKKIKEKKKIINKSELNKEEKLILKIVEENKTIFQADLIDKTGFNKAKVTRILDRLESRNFIERKRRGMTNIVILNE